MGPILFTRVPGGPPKECQNLIELTGNTVVSYVFATFTLPYFTDLHMLWYRNVDGKNVKVLPANIADLLTPIAIAYWLGGGRP